MSMNLKSALCWYQVHKDTRVPTIPEGTVSISGLWLTDGLEAVEKAEVEAAVDEDAGTGYPEAAVQPTHAVRSTVQ